MKALSLLLFISLSALGQDYTLYQPENDHYRSYTREELSQRMGGASELLSQYACNERDELDVFWPALRSNSMGHSLTIQLYKSEEKIIYREGVFYTLSGEIQTDLSNVFVSYVADALKKIEEIPEGRILLRELERSYFPLTIALGNNMFNPKDDAGRSYHGIYRANALSIFSQGRMTSEEVPFNNIGAGGTIGWNPKTTVVLPHIALAHEMYHAFDSIRGLLDLRFVQGKDFEFVSVSEYRAVYFENLARKTSGIPYRTHYGEDQTGSGVLDEHGEPRRMPSPCLKDI
jgi:hypothetical protein